MSNERQQFEQEIIERAWEDETFRQALIEDPKGTIAAEYGTRFPDDVDLEVVEETPTKAYFVIPVNPAATVELSESELELVAGGESCSMMWCSSSDNTNDRKETEQSLAP